MGVRGEEHEASGRVKSSPVASGEHDVSGTSVSLLRKLIFLAVWAACVCIVPRRIEVILKLKAYRACPLVVV